MSPAKLLPGEHFEPLSPRLELIVSRQHCFSTDTILLAWFAAPKRKDCCCDLGTGCGAIPLLWESRFQPSRIYGLELQPEAADMAARSVAHNGLTEKITILCRDLRTLCSEKAPPFAGGFDLVACNPPYMEQGGGLVNPDSARAMARHEQTCTLTDICAAAARALRYGGRFCLCQRPQRLPAVLGAMARAGLEPKRLRLVQQRPESAPNLFLAEGRKGGRPGLAVEPVLCIEENGDFSPAMREIYGTYKYTENGEERTR